ncbi:hypothetical protein Pla52o_04370 [Novipirellula galeiformis]|uniref:Zinc-finger domain-containing protein n=1 Tax=Novipirellula galeiformis TaxID=2528004 RepID=A0A5C6CSP2_9BACT|nr:hypothetical protein [Novipirellula galeiformis]TWU26584.1 hypothetical protein Pla52o_04370 [Novipirellula galeiformis]
MTCDEFMATLQDQLDQQESLLDHRGLQLHASQCEQCRGRWIAWQQIATVLPTHSLHRHPVSTRRLGHRNVMLGAILAMAASLLVAFLVPRSPEPAIAVVAAASSPRAPERAVVPMNARPMNSVENATYLLQTNPAVWLQDVQQRDWLGNTMPTVRSFGEGVAPIGRSLLRAVTLLTTSGNG